MYSQTLTEMIHLLFETLRKERKLLTSTTNSATISEVDQEERKGCKIIESLNALMLAAAEGVLKFLFIFTT